MIPIKYIIGDATYPVGVGRKLIVHVCNDAGAWGAGFVLALSAKEGWPERVYQEWYDDRSTLPPELNFRPPFALGEILFAPFNAPDVFVCNMIAQHGTMRVGRLIPLRYTALRHCLRKLATKAHEAQASVHMPRIGCGLAGGMWEAVQPIIMQELCAYNVPVTVYDLPQESECRYVEDGPNDVAIATGMYD